MIAASKNCEDPTLEVNLKFYIYNQEKRVINLNNALKNKSVEEKKEVILDLLKKCDEKEQRDPSVRGPSVRGPSYRTPIPFSVQGIKLSFLKLDKGSPGVKYLVMGMHGHGKSTFINAINLLQYSIYPKLNLQQNIDRLYNGLSTSKFYGICAMVGTKGTVYRRSDYTCPNPSKDLSEEQVNDDFKKITFKVKTDRNENPTTVFPYTHRVKFNDDAGSAYDMIFIDTPGLRFETCSVEEQLLHYIYHLEEASKKAEFPFNHFLFVVEDTFIRDGRITTLLNPLKRILHEDTFKKAVGSKCISFVVTTKQPQSFTGNFFVLVVAFINYGLIFH